MSIGSSPPAQPPMMSPDGKWVWNGQAWIPVAVHQSVFHQYNQAVAEAQTEAPLAETMVAPPVNPFATAVPQAPSGSAPWAAPAAAPAVASPAIVAPPMSYTARGETPPWQQWAAGGSGRSRTMYMVGAVIALVLGVVLTIYFVSYQLPFLRADNGQTNTNTPPAVTPTPQLPDRSDAAIAGRYVTSVIGPALDVLNGPLTAYGQACNGTLSFSCQQALTNLDSASKAALAKFGQTAPPCIAAQAARVKYDIGVIDAGAIAGLKGYADNNRIELQNGLNEFTNGFRPLEADIKAVSQAQTTCDDQHTGP